MIVTTTTTITAITTNDSGTEIATIAALEIDESAKKATTKNS